MELENFCGAFITTFYLVEYLSGFESDTPISEVLVFLEADLKHYLDKKSKGLTIRDKFEIIQTKFFIEAIKGVCKVKPFKTAGDLKNLFTEYLESNCSESILKG